MPLSRLVVKNISRLVVACVATVQRIMLHQPMPLDRTDGFASGLQPLARGPDGIAACLALAFEHLRRLLRGSGGLAIGIKPGMGQGPAAARIRGMHQVRTDERPRERSSPKGARRRQGGSIGAQRKQSAARTGAAVTKSQLKGVGLGTTHWPCRTKHNLEPSRRPGSPRQRARRLSPTRRYATRSNKCGKDSATILGVGYSRSGSTRTANAASSSPRANAVGLYLPVRQEGSRHITDAELSGFRDLADLYDQKTYAEIALELKAKELTEICHVDEA